MTRQRTNDLQRMRDLQALAQNTAPTRERSDDLQRLEAMRTTAIGQTHAFSIFCLGSGVSQTAKDPNQADYMILQLAKSCDSPKFICDGPGGEGDWSIHGITGWGMNDRLREAVAAIKQARPDVVVMTGHSRGAILCHMIAFALADDPATNRIAVKMIVLDPVHQSLIPHRGAETFHENLRLESYHSIVMEHDNLTIAKVPVFPYKFVKSSESQEKRMHYIRIPGNHVAGVGDDPVSMTCRHLIANYMRARGTRFNVRPATDVEMCGYFAGIHLTRQRFKDRGQEWKIGTRRRDLLQVDLHNKRVLGHVPRVRETLFDFGYFINEEHVFYFKRAFPYFYKVLSSAPQQTRYDHPRAFDEGGDMMMNDNLKRTYHLISGQIEALTFE